MKVGFFELDVTPPLGTNLRGYFFPRPMSGVKERLFAKAVAIDNDTTRFGIISVDACSMHDDCFEAIYSRVEQYLNIPRSNVILCAIHSHTGALLEGGFLCATEAERQESIYRSKLVADSLVYAFSNMKEVTARFGVGEQKEYAFVRNFLMKDGTYFTNPGCKNPNIDKVIGEIDPSVNVLSFVDSENKPVGAIINYACHCDCVGGTEASGDYPAIMSRELKKIYGDSFVSLFIQGASGNINHFDVNNEVDYSVRYKQMGVSLAEKVADIIEKSESLENTQIECKTKDVFLKRRDVPQQMFDKAKHDLETIPETNGYCNISDTDDKVMIRAFSKRLLDAYDEKAFPDSFGEDIGKNTSVQVIRFGDVHFYALPGEVFNRYSFYIKDNSPTRKNFIAELARPGYRGYLPIPEICESDKCYEGKYLSCTVDINSGELLAKTAVELAKSM